MDLLKKRLRKASEAEVLAQTVEVICDPTALAPLAPPVLKQVAAVTAANLAETRSLALQELSAALSATRNEVAHAKANYDKKGQECPVDQHAQFAAMLRVLAQQAICWLADQSPEMRAAGPPTTPQRGTPKPTKAERSKRQREEKKGT